MFNLSSVEVLIILAVALMVLGPQQVPKIAAQLGKGLRDLQRAANDFKREVTESAREAERALDVVDAPLKKAPGDRPVDPYAAIAKAAAARSAAEQTPPDGDTHDEVPEHPGHDGYPPGDPHEFASIPDPHGRDHAAPRPSPLSIDKVQPPRIPDVAGPPAPPLSVVGPVDASDRDAAPLPRVVADPDSVAFGAPLPQGPEPVPVSRSSTPETGSTS